MIKARKLTLSSVIASFAFAVLSFSVYEISVVVILLILSYYKKIEKYYLITLFSFFALKIYDPTSIYLLGNSYLFFYVILIAIHIALVGYLIYYFIKNRLKKKRLNLYMFVLMLFPVLYYLGIKSEIFSSDNIPYEIILTVLIISLFEIVFFNIFVTSVKTLRLKFPDITKKTRILLYSVLALIIIKFLFAVYFENKTDKNFSHKNTDAEISDLTIARWCNPENAETRIKLTDLSILTQNFSQFIENYSRAVFLSYKKNIKKEWKEFYRNNSDKKTQNILSVFYAKKETVPPFFSAIIDFYSKSSELNLNDYEILLSIREYLFNTNKVEELGNLWKILREKDIIVDFDNMESKNAEKLENLVFTNTGYIAFNANFLTSEIALTIEGNGKRVNASWPVIRIFVNEFMYNEMFIMGNNKTIETKCVLPMDRGKSKIKIQFIAYGYGDNTGKKFDKRSLFIHKLYFKYL